jgi:hypothetical protein
MDIREWLLRSEEIVKQLGEEINRSKISLKEAEEKILEHINRLGQIMVDEVVEELREPVFENRVEVAGEVAVFSGVRNLRFINRFGGQTVKARRCYKYLKKGGGYYPLDEKLGLDVCGGFSPLLTYLQVLFGASEPFERSEELLSESIGFKVCATAIQRNTEITGARMEEDPYKVIAREKQQEECEMMLVEVDGTTSPQISEVQGVRGRESLKAKTEWKECNVVVIEKYTKAERTDRWIGARYGPQKEFEEYVRRAGLRMGQLGAEQVVFIADGLAFNWEIQKTNFPGAVTILDFYHASEHLGKFCKLFKDETEGKSSYDNWYTMLLNGEVLEVIAEMKEEVQELTDTAAGWKHINYFKKNIDRMNYDEYKEAGLPIGSGLVEGNCKFVVGKRFKGSGMRWKRADNIKVLQTRLAKLNGNLPDYFRPQPQQWTLPNAA